MSTHHICLVPFINEDNNGDLLYVYVDGDRVGCLESCGEGNWAVYVSGRQERLTTKPTVHEATFVVLDYVTQEVA